jgi:putative salt-induced outer membrane protein YdiY
MNHKLSLIALVTTCYLPLSVLAKEPVAVEKSPFSSSAELGFLYKTGNTKSADINAGLSVKYEKDLWLSTFDLNILAKKIEKSVDGSEDKSLITTEQKWTVNSKTNYTLDSSSKNYVYGNVYYEDNRFTSYDNQSSMSAGWGRNWYKTDKASFFADIGPGFKRDVTKATDTIPSETNTSLIVQAQALYLRKINDFVEFKQTLSAKMSTKSGDNSTYKAESSITTKLIKTLQLKFTVAFDYNSKVDIDKENLDTQTSVTLVYSF